MRTESAVQIESVPCEGCRREFRRAVGDPEYLCPSCRRRMRINLGEGTESDELACLASVPDALTEEHATYQEPHTTHPLECEACGRLFRWESNHVRNDRPHDYGFCPCGGTILFR